MRKSVLIFVLFADSVFGQFVPYQKPPLGTQINHSHPLSKGLVGCWLMNEGTGGKLCDSSGNDNNGTVSGSSNWQAGNFGSVLDFNGTTDYVNCGSGASLDNLRTLTLSCWIYRDNTNSRDFLGKTGGHSFRVRDSGQNYALGFIYKWPSSSWGAAYWYATTAINTGNWYHVAVTYDASSTSNDPIFYVNGNPDAISSEPSSPYGSVSDDSAGNYLIACDGTMTELFDGRLDNVMVWNHVLSDSEIAQLYREPFCIFEQPIISSMFYAADTSDWLGINSSQIDSVCGETSGWTLAEALDGTSSWYHGVNEVHSFILDLGAVYNISKVRGRSRSDVYDPTNINVYVSNSKENWGTAVASGITTWQDRGDWDGDAVIDCTPKNGRYIKVEITSTEDLYLDFGEEYGPPFFKIFDAYGFYVSGVGQPQIILIQMGAIPLFVLALCVITKKRK